VSLSSPYVSKTCTRTNAPVARYRKTENAYCNNTREKLGITDISRAITNFITRSGSYVLKVCLKRNIDLVTALKQSNPKDVQSDKNRSDLGKKHKSLNCDAVKNFELHVHACFILTCCIEKIKI
jgi:hypothetical protein